MVKLLLLCFFVTGAASLETGLGSCTAMGALWPDMCLLLVLTYAALGRGRFLAVFCFTCGLMKGVGCSEPAGLHMLAYISIGYFLHGTRSVFFVERPLTQIVLSFFLGCFYWLLQLCGRWFGVLPHLPPDMLLSQLYSCISTACLAPLVFPVYKRLSTARKLLHP